MSQTDLVISVRTSAFPSPDIAKGQAASWDYTQMQNSHQAVHECKYPILHRHIYYPNDPEERVCVFFVLFHFDLLLLLKKLESQKNFRHSEPNAF